MWGHPKDAESVSFLLAVTQLSDKKKLGRGRALLQFKEGSWWGGLETKLLSLFLFSPGLQPVGWCCPRLWLAFSSQLTHSSNPLTDALRGLFLRPSHIPPSWWHQLSQRLSTLPIRRGSAVHLEKIKFRVKEIKDLNQTSVVTTTMSSGENFVNSNSRFATYSPHDPAHLLPLWNGGSKGSWCLGF